MKKTEDGQIKGTVKAEEMEDRGAARKEIKAQNFSVL
jgi:hypothetical protein